MGALLAGRTTGNFVEERLLAEIQDGLDGRVSADKVTISVLGGPKVELTGLKVATSSDGPPILEAPSASLAVEFSEEEAGGFAGVLSLEDPDIRVRRDSFGHLQVSSFLSGSERFSSLVAAAATRAVHQVRIENGTVYIFDQTKAGQREVQLASVDALLSGIAPSSPARLEGRAGLESERQNVRVSGSVGPWDGPGPARYRFSKFELDQVPLASLSWVRGVMRGNFSYRGTVDTAGNGWDDLSANISGRGRVRIASGALVGRNVVAETLAPWLSEGTAPAALQGLLAGGRTPFEEISGQLTMRRSTVETSNLLVRGNGYEAVGRGKLGSAGEVDFEGVLTISAAVSQGLTEILPATKSLLDQGGQIAIPVRLAGKWPDIRATVDLGRVASRILPSSPFDWFAAFPARESAHPAG